jgi:hypothetical protein
MQGFCVSMKEDRSMVLELCVFKICEADGGEPSAYLL